MRGLGQIAWLASFTRPDVGADHEHRARAPRARRDGRERRARQGRADRGAAAGRHRGRARGAAARAVPHAHDIEIRRFGHVEEPGVFRVGERDDPPRDELHGAPPARQHARRARRLRRARRPRRRTARSTSSSRALREEELELPGGVLLINDCYNANPLSMRAALAAPRRARRRRGAASPCSARWPSWARRRSTTTARSARRGRGRGVDELIAVGPLAREYAAAANGVVAHYADTAADAADALARAAPPGRRRARQGLARGGTRSRRGETDAADDTRPRRSADRAHHLARSPGRSSSTSCASARTASRSARKGRSTTSASRARRRWAAC